MKPSLADIKRRAKLPEYSSGEGYVQVPFSDWTELLWLLEQAEKAEQELERLPVLIEALESISRLVSWCNHGEADRGTTLAKIDEIASAALSEQPEKQR